MPLTDMVPVPQRSRKSELLSRNKQDGGRLDLRLQKVLNMKKTKKTKTKQSERSLLTLSAWLEHIEETDAEFDLARDCYIPEGTEMFFSHADAYIARTILRRAGLAKPSFGQEMETRVMLIPREGEEGSITLLDTEAVLILLSMLQLVPRLEMYPLAIAQLMKEAFSTGRLPVVALREWKELLG